MHQVIYQLLIYDLLYFNGVFVRLFGIYLVNLHRVHTTSQKKK